MNFDITKSHGSETGTVYRLDVTFTDPKGLVCRALMYYDLWLLVPKIEAEAEISASVRPVRRQN
ncbi:MAG: hypothetical protein DWQ47_07525 [Acidobacteria bacterium]|nr:MAG: hypothetical protein DWQ32_15625 [Acidobacteriota bacterium]REJ99227.1 MAG: hypothetical protein DWQ38_14350 [Acidobacteriota bacterium]REK16052.1 MAG: hypothetical protein DWQ43_03335 [Acidobacteriota bacterium]REK43733.1 MAG: hypothetical protein DWQ47_07525 [Acidobacteriota bacterium]